MLHDHDIPVNGSFVLGFDHDGPDVFAQTAEWAEAIRLECATFHVLTPYPGTPLFGRMEAEGRLLHRRWSRYDTARVVFRLRRMSVEQLNTRAGRPRHVGGRSPDPNHAVSPVARPNSPPRPVGHPRPQQIRYVPASKPAVFP